MFQKTVIQKYLKIQDQNKIKEKWNLFQKHFHNPTIQENIRNSKEEQYQGEFLIDLFVNVFGYTKNPAPDFNLTTEYKNVKDSKKADGAIIVNDSVLAIIELKGTNTTDLSKVEDQAFGYKNNQPDCKYVITSNFEKLRFYIDNAIENLEFNLFELNEDEFKLLYLCLAYENIVAQIPSKLKAESISQEDAITKKLYKDYSVFKRELFQNLVELNPEYDALELFKKSQKLLDRLLFLFFGEDRGLLPPNSVRMILEQWNKLKDLDEYTPLYNRLKKYFGYLNTGFKGKQYDVFAYNGGLFKEDDILDHIKIDDELLYKHSLKLSEYDFASEVDVNILGHIFENSLNELDEVKAQLEGQEIDKSKTKRKKDGVFYTPKYITKYIVENTVGKLCEEKKAEIGVIEEEYFTDKKRQQKTKLHLLEKLDEYRAWLHQLTIVDPACGSGAFLNEALNFLIAEHQYVDELEAKLTGSSIAFTYHSESILENNLFGVDLNEESVEIAKLSLWLRTAEPNRKLNSLNNNIKCGNSLIDDPEVAGDKAFTWQQEFPQVFAKGGFDVVIGNPPYVRRTQISENLKIEIDKKYQSAYKQYDLYVLFNELSVYITKPNSFIGFIQPNKFLSAEYGLKINIFLLNNVEIKSIYDVSLDNVFSEASVYPYIFIYRKNPERKSKISDGKNLLEFSEKLIGFEKIEESKKIIDKINLNSIIVKDITSKIRRGVPNNLIEYSINGETEALKSTDLSVAYILPNASTRITYNHPFEKQNKVNEFLKNLFLFPRTVLKIRAIYKDKDVHILDRIYYFENNSDLNDKYLLAFFNSRILTFFYDYVYGSTKIGGGYIDLKGSQIENFPIKNIPLEQQQPFIEKADQMLSLNKELQEISGKFQRNLQREFSIEKLSKKLESWFDLSYDDFLKELKKLKIELTLSQKAEWEDYFLQEKAKALDCQSNIQSTDKEIDQMVYALYGLTEEEIDVVEKG